MRYLSESYLSESRDQNGEVCHISLHYSEDFNWAYDVVDNIAETEPDRPAMTSPDVPRGPTSMPLSRVG